jgi:hypothetical protein
MEETDETVVCHPTLVSAGNWERNRSEPSPTKQTTCFQGAGLKLMVSIVWTETGRPFMT